MKVGDRVKVVSYQGLTEPYFVGMAGVIRRAKQGYWEVHLYGESFDATWLFKPNELVLLRKKGE